MTVEYERSTVDQEQFHSDKKLETQNGHYTCTELYPLQNNEEGDNDRKDVNTVTIEHQSRHLIYRISDTPPILLTLFFAFQQAVVSVSSCVTTVALVSEFVCARDLEDLKVRMLCTTFLMSGICTILQVTFGSRLPVFQGPSKSYIIPLIVLADLPEFKCPSVTRDIDDLGNITLANTTTKEMLYEIAMIRLQWMEGSLIVAGLIHMFVGMSGMMGFLLRFIGPITVLTTILLSGLAIYQVIVKFCETHWGISMTTAVVSVILSLYLGKRNMSIPIWTRKKGFHIIRYPLHQVFAVLISMGIGWGLSAILTATNSLSSDPNSKEFYARTDSRLSVVSNTPVFLFPYPAQYGTFRFDIAIFISFMSATIVSIIDSVGDYYACARMSRVPAPPIHAVNRGLFIEGFSSALAGVFGCGHATTTYGSSIGLIGITKVASRRVFQVFGLIFILCSILGKFGACFITLPDAVLGGTTLVGIGIFIGLVLSNMQYIDMGSTRNLAIIGISILVGLMIPYWTKNNSNFIDTGTIQVDNLVKVLMTAPNISGGLLACILDNTVPGTREERGLENWGTAEESEDDLAFDLEETAHVYEIARVSRWLKKFECLRFIPIFPQYNPSELSLKACRKQKGKSV